MKFKKQMKKQLQNQREFELRLQKINEILTRPLNKKEKK